MRIRKAQIYEIPEIMEIYAGARKFMCEHGNEKQWINGYPSREIVEKDCLAGHLYVCEEKEIAGVFMFCTEPEPTYAKIYEGEWLNDRPYGTMHRMASAGKEKGVSAFCLAWCYEQCKNVRGDTHEDNYVMQRVFEKNGFKRCGIIYVANGTPRIAYQKEQE